MQNLHGSAIAATRTMQCKLKTPFEKWRSITNVVAVSCTPEQQVSVTCFRFRFSNEEIHDGEVWRGTVRGTPAKLLHHLSAGIKHYFLFCFVFSFNRTQSRYRLRPSTWTLPCVTPTRRETLPPLWSSPTEPVETWTSSSWSLCHAPWLQPVSCAFASRAKVWTWATEWRLIALCGWEMRFRLTNATLWRFRELTDWLVFPFQDYLKSLEKFDIRHIFVGGKDASFLMLVWI